MRKRIALVLTAAVLAAGIGYWVGLSVAPQPDWTVAPCTMTHVPAYTYTDICVASDGSITHR